MFDRIAHVALFARDVSRDLRLYRDHLGFGERGRWCVSERSMLHHLWGLPEGPLEVIELSKPDALEVRRGGEILLVSGPSLPDPNPRSMALPGPFALDFYVRDLAEKHAELVADGFSFLSEPVHYALFGTDFEVDEVMLRSPAGLVHALIEWKSDRHRCLLSENLGADVSELIALVMLTDDIDAGLRTVRDAFGATVYLDTVFHGPEIVELLSLPEGSSFRAALLRGPSRGNGRFELMATSPGVTPALGEPSETPRAHPGAVPIVNITALDEVLERLDASHGRVCGPLVVDDGPYAGMRSITLWPSWGGPVGLVEGAIARTQ